MKGFVRVVAALAAAGVWVWAWHTFGLKQMQSSATYVPTTLAIFFLVLWMFDKVYELFMGHV